ncbi:GNAT family N-acetyltransferase, partial [Streptomyces heliomycini]
MAPEPYDSPVAAALWRAYRTEAGDHRYPRHEGRRTDPGEPEREIAAVPGTDLAPSEGLPPVARYAGEPAGGAGV